MGKTSNESKRKYNEKAYDRIQIVVKKGDKELVKACADKAGLSVNRFICEAIKEKMQRTPTGSGQSSVSGTAPSDEQLTADVCLLDLGVREYNMIKRAGCNTVGELIRYLDSDRCVIAKEGRAHKSIEEALKNFLAPAD